MACLTAPVHLAGAAPAPFLGWPLCHPAQLQSFRWWAPAVWMLSASGNRIGRVTSGKKLRAEYSHATCSEAAVQLPHVATSIQSLEGLQPTSLEQRSTMPLRSYSLREANLDEEIWAASWLRAQSYKEDQQHPRYIESHKRKFAEQEFTALKRRVSGRVGQSITCICFIAVMDTIKGDDIGEQVDPILNNVIGTLDISCREVLPGQPSPNEPRRSVFSLQVSQMLGLHRYAYISNLCVSKAARRNGVASRLLQTASEVAKEWGLREIYVQVLPNNLAAQRLYAKHGFHPVQTAMSEMPSTEPVLLCRSM